ncbi:hypothetical protein [Salicola sp. Rm-C-2C1-2]|uniref:hypothetical protein n=1 Tax=Salicola sp. Rm-C-2C1-2 TaxID=3141321 RepID=UPI0032E42171
MSHYLLESFVVLPIENHVALYPLTTSPREPLIPGIFHLPELLGTSIGTLQSRYQAYQSLDFKLGIGYRVTK